MNPIILHYGKNVMVFYPQHIRAFYPLTGYQNKTVVETGEKESSVVDESPTEILHLIEAAAVTKCCECVYGYKNPKEEVPVWICQQGRKQNTYSCGEGQRRAELIIKELENGPPKTVPS